MRLEIDSDESTITLNGMTLSLDALEAIINPEPGRSRQFIRIGDRVLLADRKPTPTLIDRIMRKIR